MSDKSTSSTTYGHISHSLNASSKSVHWGYFDPALDPVVEIKNGDIVDISTVSGGPDVLPLTDYTVTENHREILNQVTRRMLPGHILTGPVAIEGAQPGDVLEVKILDISLAGDWGWNVIRPLQGTLPEKFHKQRLIHIGIDQATGKLSLPWGMKLKARPFFGVMGVAPPLEWGVQSSVEPRAFGGNLDLRHLVPGATLYLPVFRPGALFSIGDGHAIQGDGEVCLTAVETALRGIFQLNLRKDMQLDGPFAETDSHYITIGLDPDLDDAAKTALWNMISLLEQRHGMSKEDAYSLFSMVGDLHVTQLVNRSKGVHGMLAKSLFT